MLYKVYTVKDNRQKDRKVANVIELEYLSSPFSHS